MWCKSDDNAIHPLLVEAIIVVITVVVVVVVVVVVATNGVWCVELPLHF